MRRFLWPIVLIGCSTTTDPPELTRFDGAPAVAPLAAGQPVALTAAPTTLASIGGVVVIGTTEGVYRTTLTGAAADPVRVIAEAGQAMTLGHVTAIAPRGTDGLLVAAQNGLFHDMESALVVSPFTPLLEGERVDGLDITGRGADEALWVTTARGAFVRRSAGATTLSLSSAPVKRAIGIDGSRALLFADGLYEIDVDAGTVRRLGDDPGDVRGVARDDGNLYVATRGGLLVRRADGEVALHTLASEGEAPRAIQAVAAGVGLVALVVGEDVVVRDAGGSRVVGRAELDANAIAIDANEDLWVASPRGLSRYATGKPVSFEQDVKPFMSQRCMPCHAAGGGAPTRAFDTFDVAQSFAPEIVRRLRADGRPVMPPSGGLTATDYRAVVRWALTGTPR